MNYPFGYPNPNHLPFPRAYYYPFQSPPGMPPPFYIPQSMHPMNQHYPFRPPMMVSQTNNYFGVNYDISSQSINPYFQRIMEENNPFKKLKERSPSAKTQVKIEIVELSSNSSDKNPEIVQINSINHCHGKEKKELKCFKIKNLRKKDLATTKEIQQRKQMSDHNKVESKKCDVLAQFQKNLKAAQPPPPRRSQRVSKKRFIQYNSQQNSEEKIEREIVPQLVITKRKLIYKNEMNQNKKQQAEMGKVREARCQIMSGDLYQALQPAFYKIKEKSCYQKQLKDELQERRVH